MADDMRMSDWISDVCSSDLTAHPPQSLVALRAVGGDRKEIAPLAPQRALPDRLEQRRVGKVHVADFAAGAVDDHRLDIVGGRHAGPAGHLDIAEAVIGEARSEEHTSELQSLMRISYAVFCLKKKN